jgi:hypothetical protein
MIQELIESILTPATREARKLGYLYETIALKQRYRRNKREWQAHIDNCRRHTLAALGPAKHMAILGSGPLLEIPMDDLIARCERITLVDFVHPREVRAKWGRHPKVELIEADLLGIAAELLRWKSGPLPRPRVPEIRADFVLSANCLSQLALMPRQFLEKKIAPADLDDYSEKLAAAHLREVKKQTHLLIADFETRVIGENGETIERSAPFFDRASLKMLDSWNWRLAPPGEIYKRRSVEMSAGAFTIL